MMKHIILLRTIWLLALAFLADSILTSHLFAKVPVTNIARTTLVRVSTETDSGSSQINAAGAGITIVGAGTASLDSANIQDITAFFGQLDPTTMTLIDPANIPPELIIKTPAIDQTVPNPTTTYFFSGTASDIDGAVIQVEFRKNGGSWKSSTGTTNWNFTVRNLQVGTNVVEVRAKDNDGDYSPANCQFISKRANLEKMENLFGVKGRVVKRVSPKNSKGDYHYQSLVDNLKLVEKDTG